MVGESVIVWQRVDGEKDSHGNVTKTWKAAATVPGCLVRSASTSDLADEQRPDGAIVRYSIAFPKTYAGPALRGCRVTLPDRGMAEADAMDVVGEPSSEPLAPTLWDMVCEVGRVDG
ncbi:MAG: hypothetical protein SOV20_08805 [Coriobacteriales bacterium]|nr:hypothetical protein [Coriobacteriaceae bacterium]MDY2723897.1 hypothetical protein [Coriobacteriales bacterium]